MGSIRRYWWLVATVTAVVVVVFTARSAVQGSQYTATTTLYIGQPMSPTGTLTGTIGGTSATAIEIAKGDAAIAAAVKAAGQMSSPTPTSREVRSGLSATAANPPLASKLISPPSILKIQSTMDERSAVHFVAEAVAKEVMRVTNRYAKARIEVLSKREEDLKEALAFANAQFTKVSTQVATSGGGDQGAVLTSLLNTLATERRQVNNDLDQATLTRQFAEEIEMSKVLSKPEATKVVKPALATQLPIALLLGLILGSALVIALDAFRTRRIAA